MVGGAVYSEVLDIFKEHEVLEEEGRFIGRPVITNPSEQAVVDRKLSSVKVWAVGCRGDERAPTHKI
jgi:hypothetical protein